MLDRLIEGPDRRRKMSMRPRLPPGSCGLLAWAALGRVPAGGRPARLWQASVARQTAAVARHADFHREAACGAGRARPKWRRGCAGRAGFRFFTLSWPALGAGCDPLPEAELKPLIQQAAQKEGLDAGLLRAVAEQESGFRSCAVSPKGAMGLMQLMPATAQELGVHDPFDPAESLLSGARLLKQLLTRFGGDTALALGAYNAGAGTRRRERRCAPDSGNHPLRAADPRPSSPCPNSSPHIPRRPPDKLCVGAFWADAEEHLRDGQQASQSGSRIAIWAILIGPARRNPHAGWRRLGPARLLAQHGAKTAYRVTREGGRVCLEGVADGETCLLRSESPAAAARHLLATVSRTARARRCPSKAALASRVTRPRWWKYGKCLHDRAGPAGDRTGCAWWSRCCGTPIRW